MSFPQKISRQTNNHGRRKCATVTRCELISSRSPPVLPFQVHETFLDSCGRLHGSASADRGLSRMQRLDCHGAMPTLYKIVHATLSPSYSCRSAQDLAAGYANTALFLSDSSKNVNAPELLFNGACGAPDYLQVQMAGDDLSLITDYGAVALTDWETQFAFFTTPQRQVDALASFSMQSSVQVGHTYGVVINKSNYVRGLLYFTVTAYVPNQKVDLDYAVMDYQILNLQSQSPGFDWNAKPN